MRFCKNQRSTFMKDMSELEYTVHDINKPNTHGNTKGFRLSVYRLSDDAENAAKIFQVRV